MIVHARHRKAPRDSLGDGPRAVWNGTSHASVNDEGVTDSDLVHGQSCVKAHTHEQPNVVEKDLARPPGGALLRVGQHNHFAGQDRPGVGGFDGLEYGTGPGSEQEQASEKQNPGTKRPSTEHNHRSPTPPWQLVAKPSCAKNRHDRTHDLEILLQRPVVLSVVGLRHE